MKNILLITLGNSPMIVPEAVLGYGISFDEVHVFTTDNPQLYEHAAKLHDIFETHFPAIKLSISGLSNVPLPNTTESHQLFEEALFQWYLEKAGDALPYACITGGTKTIPASMQQAARYFGATDVFHLLSDMPAKENPTTIAGVFSVVEAGKINFISMGAEAGWEALRTCTTRQQFSSTLADPNISALWLKEKSSQLPLTRNIAHIMQSVKVAATGLEEQPIPFSMLRLLPPEKYSWLHKPLDAERDLEWIKTLPKTDLHCHLGGFATQPPLLNKVVGAALEPAALIMNLTPLPPNGWPKPDKTITLPQYMRLGDANGSALLKDAGCLKKQVELMYAHFQEQNIRYAEVRCSPDNYASTDRPAWIVLQDIQQNFQRLMDEALANMPDNTCHVNLLVIATRKTEGDLSSISRHLALAITAAQYNAGKGHCCAVVGVDLAGYENKDTRPAYFANDFIGVHRSGLAVTAHAGENDDAESIWQAVHQLHARRIGHGLQLFQAKDLMRTMADRRIGIEMCPYANYQIRGFMPMLGKETEIYQLLNYMKAGIPVSINTDNIGISAANISDNFIWLARMLPDITRMEILQLVRNGIETAFLSADAKNTQIRRMDRQIFEVCLK
ncbi:MAG: hypothetical protein EAY75_10225 [Bacteroidetes bacterium]|nr:MAG: hypothetical protein EAY75_10225 [Bacteroidota bacterium]